MSKFRLQHFLHINNSDISITTVLSEWNWGKIVKKFSAMILLELVQKVFSWARKISVVETMRILHGAVLVSV